MRRPSIFAQRSGELEIKMTPMIDVVFLLLIFFVWTASFQIVEQLLPSSVSMEKSAAGAASQVEIPPEELDFEQVVVRLLWQDGHIAWTINQAPVGSLKELRSRLAGIAKIKSDAPVVIDPDAEVPLGHVIDVYDVARLEHFSKVQFATSAEL